MYFSSNHASPRCTFPWIFASMVPVPPSTRLLEARTSHRHAAALASLYTSSFSLSAWQAAALPTAASLCRIPTTDSPPSTDPTLQPHSVPITLPSCHCGMKRPWPGAPSEVEMSRHTTDHCCPCDVYSRRRRQTPRLPEAFDGGAMP
ncbi:uncharacterized protein K452DRAFT_138299 [Aplosporella prunicola CBS 121167]|uniref:Uncharacterized protein n=1 Tax=Aplosporella prunicola CBS 121167 TaxID=1176127 RepID=A0A6A6AWH5_9PEZI|nr:uncharacterized protein K452DRAFT_139065 [Aplosporella prunicola CBS 121167]XP_033392070.1 uncharacterized protein K452DRAFT_138299 [Aplosporella prunicola CBS 121167]KAF2136266.1 hypothetical protein K452DRAFT_139065 [Aplosporella prunicola CBS 121167]KAF2136352.1 hypothetical protein K452DRAFT_138299 [Aplosporella prunicola CBS 121167]